jgi:hypothetical protein
MRTSLALALVFAAACGPSARDRPPGGGDDGPDGGNGSNVGSGNEDGCSDAAKLVYVVDENYTFSQFDPSTKTFHDLGQLNCPAGGGATPFSMSVDRDAIAWVLYSDGSLYRVDTNGLACTETSWHSTSGLTQFGMGFSTDSSGGSTDTLFVAGGASVNGANSSTLAKLDTSSMTATTVGTVTGWPELTGTGTAELWGWFPSDETGTTTPRVEKLDKTSGAPLQTFNLSSLTGAPSAWAFAFWGGDFWVFLAKDLDFATTVYQIDGTNGTIKGMTPTGSRLIVGAGVSTCAPVVIGRTAP